MLILGIETSCDETSASIVEDGVKVRSNVVSSQIKIHEAYGGVVPELAARAHLENVVPVVDEALRDAGIIKDQIDGLAVTCGPGLVGPLLVGVSFAKGVAASRNLPLVGVHHIEAHLYAPRLAEPDLPYPHVALVASGGHTNLIRVDGIGRYHVLGRTLDDASGECFDKTAQFLGLGFPGGPAIQRAAREAVGVSIALPRPMLDQEGYDFSFSGLKTALMNAVRRMEEEGQERDVKVLARSVEEAIVDTLVEKSIRACRRTGVRALTLSGGVAANARLRDCLNKRCEGEGIRLILTPRDYCTDNAAMIAGLGYCKILNGERAGEDLNADPRLPLPGGERVR